MNDPKLQTDFIREICTYFMDFLQSNFKRGRIPKRHIKLKDAKGFKVGVDASKYPDFNKALKNVVIKNFKEPSDKLKITKGKYTKKTDNKTADLIKKSINSIKNSDIDKLKKFVSKSIKDNSKNFKKDSKEAHDRAYKEIEDEFKKIIIEPIKNICEPLILSQSVHDIDSLYTLEVGLSDHLIGNLEENISDMMNDILSNHSKDISIKIDNLLDIEVIKEKLLSYFDSLNINDLYFEIQELYTSKFNLDKQEFYFYFYEIEVQNKRFPIFYMPISLSSSSGDSTFTINFEKEIYINKKAIQYATSEFSRDNSSVGKIDSIVDRIIYVDEENDLLVRLDKIVKEISNFFRLQNTLDVTNTSEQIEKNASCIVSNNCSINVFDKSDESLINDYEDILNSIENEDSDIAKMFKDIINDFLMKDPHSVITELEDNWDASSTSDRLNYTSPIPLNYEQQKIIKALDNKDCKYVVVEGPPGTGKSHTISAIAFNYILANKSILILSDTKYALDVVEDKLNDTLNKARHSEDFQNPILRLGKMGNTYSKILSNQSISQIRDFHRSSKTYSQNLSSHIETINKTIEDNLINESGRFEKLDNEKIQTYLKLHLKFTSAKSILDLNEIDNNTKESKIDILDFITFIQSEKDNELFKLFLSSSSKANLKSYEDFLQLIQFIGTLDKDNNFNQEIVSLFKLIKKGYPGLMDNYSSQFRNLKGAFFGYTFKGSEVSDLIVSIKNKLQLKKELDLREEKDSNLFSNAFNNLQRLENDIESNLKKNNISFSYDKFYDLLTSNKNLINLCKKENETNNLKNILDFAKKIPLTCENLGININNPESIFKNKIIKFSADDKNEILDYLESRSTIADIFQSVNDFDYATAIAEKQSLYTSLMTTQLDGKILDFFDANRTTAKTLSKIIRSKSKFPTNEFNKLRQAFPCIIASVRDFAEYINLKKDLFDLIIIDEASQVSIAQALPALIRAKKVLVLGDKKQFNNVKSMQAARVENNFYLERIKQSFKKISNDRQILERLKLFDVTSSVLEFFTNIANYETMLKKHFRGYKEHISYSSKYFYNNEIQAIRLRSPELKNKDIIKFDIIDAKNREDTIGNSNKSEAEFIIKQLEKLKKDGYKGTVGIITPFADQQKLLSTLISRHVDRDYYFEKFSLKIWTFDTCQGEERQVIFYSMVDDKKNKKLWSVFPKSLEVLDFDDGSNAHRAQRLNVGFSRVQECMWFVMSKDPSEVDGEIGNAIRHFYNIYQTKEQLPKEKDLDVNSPKEKEVLKWIINSDFYHKYKDVVTLEAQFPIGDYLKQLDPKYTHPKYKTDFLLSARINDINHNIVIEYDGFDYHFKKEELIDEFNFEDFYTEDHMERQRALEAYGYKFIRLNRFNCSDDPVNFLSRALFEATDKKNINKIRDSIVKTAMSVASKDSKYCKTCKKVKLLDEFKDETLKTKYGNVCNSCRRPRTFWRYRSRYRRW
jgi:hypothetical protein